jgi:hypothetical protein
MMGTLACAVGAIVRGMLQQNMYWGPICGGPLSSAIASSAGNRAVLIDSLVPLFISLYN